MQRCAHFVAAVLEEREAAAQAELEAEMLTSVSGELFFDPSDWVGGNPDGDVTIVEFLDYRCGYCKRAHPEVTQLLENDGNIRLVIKEFPILGEESVLASQFALSTRFVAGDERIAGEFSSIRAAVLSAAQDPKLVRTERHCYSLQVTNLPR